MQIIRECEPYCGGKGYLIRALHELNIVDKHRPLIQQDFAMQEVHIDQQIESTPEGLVILPPVHWSSEAAAKDEDTSENSKDAVRFSCSLSFGEVEVLRSRPVRVVMEEMVQQIIEKLGKSALSQP